MFSEYLTAPCDCVTCDREGEVCHTDGTVYRCDCAEGLMRLEDNTCRGEFA